MKHNETIDYLKKQCNRYNDLFDKYYKTRVIFILVDGLPFRFLSNTSSSIKMKKIMKLISSGSFGLFKNICSYPTFTLSGMKRLFTGRDASFMDSIFNLGSSIISGDTLFKKLQENGKRILCLGDYLLFSWFPNIFTNDSVKTITTTDLRYFNDVDRMTGNYIDYAMKEKYFDWDFLLIYFLGLDQAGHFFNSDKGELIEKKINEIDEYIFKIYNDLSSKNESYVIIITGDHGMNILGSHGGSEKDEIETGFLISINGKIFNNSEDISIINQLDITPTILNLYGIETTKDSIGIANNFISNLYEKMYLIIINLKHFLLHFQLNDEFLYETEKCIALMSNEIITKCENENKIKIKNIIKCEEVVKKLQKSFILNAPTPNHVPIYFAFILAIFGVCYYIFIEFKNLSGLNVIFFIITSLLFMGSSFIDEASDVWFFLLQTFLVLQMIQFKDNDKIFKTFKIIFLCSIMHSLMQHVRRRYLIPQTNPNIVGEGRWLEPLMKDTFQIDENGIFFNNNNILFFLYIINLIFFQKLFQESFNIYFTYVLTSFTFVKIFSITNVILLLLLYIIPLLYLLKIPSSKLKLIFKIFLITYLFTPSYLVIYLPILIYTLKILLSSNFFAQKNTAIALTLLNEAAFFFNGNLLTFSSFDLSVTSVALIHDNLLSMALRLFIHTFSSYLIIYGYIWNDIKEKIIMRNNITLKQFLLYQQLIRILSLTVSELSLITFQNHIMIWSTFAPKFIFDIVLFIVTLIIHLFLLFIE